MKRKIYQRIISFLMAMILISSQLTGAMPVQAQEMPTELSAELMESEQKDPVEIVEEEPEDIIEETVEEIIEESVEEESQISFEETEISAEETDSSTEEIVSTQDASTSYVISGELVTPEDGFVQGGSLTATFCVYYNSNSYRDITITIPEFDNRNLSEDEEPLTIPYSVDLTSYITEMPETLPKVLLKINKNSNVESNLLQGKNCYYMDDSWSFDNVEGNVAVTEGKFQDLILPKAKLYGTVSLPEECILPDNVSLSINVYGSSSWSNTVSVSKESPTSFYRIDSIPLDTESLENIYVRVDGYSKYDTNVLLSTKEYYQGNTFGLTTDSEKAVAIDLTETESIDMTVLDSKLGVKICLPEDAIIESTSYVGANVKAKVNETLYTVYTEFTQEKTENTIYFNRIPTHYTELTSLGVQFNDINNSTNHRSNLITGRMEYFDGEKMVSKEPVLEEPLEELTENKMLTIEPDLTKMYLKLSLSENVWFHGGDLSGKVTVVTDTNETCSKNIVIPEGETSTDFYINNFPLDAKQIQKLYVKWNTGEVESNVILGKDLYYTGETWDTSAATVTIDLPENGDCIALELLPAKVLLPVKVLLPEDTVIYGSNLTGNVKAVVDGTTYQAKFSINAENREGIVTIALPNDATKITKLYVYVDNNENIATNLQRGETFYYYEGALTTSSKNISLAISDVLESGVSLNLLTGRGIYGAIRMPEKVRIIGGDITECYIQLKAGNTVYKYIFEIPEDVTEDTEIPYIFEVPKTATELSYVRVYVKSIKGIVTNLNTGNILYLTENGWSTSSSEALVTELQEGDKEISVTIPKYPYVKGKLSLPEDTFIENGTVTANVSVKSVGGTYSHSFALTENTREYEYFIPVKNSSVTEVTSISVSFSSTSGTITNIPLGLDYYLTESGKLSYTSSEAAVFDFEQYEITKDFTACTRPTVYGKISIPEGAYFSGADLKGRVYIYTDNGNTNVDFTIPQGQTDADIRVLLPNKATVLKYFYIDMQDDRQVTNLDLNYINYYDLAGNRYTKYSDSLAKEITDKKIIWNVEIPCSKILCGTLSFVDNPIIEGGTVTATVYAKTSNGANYNVTFDLENEKVAYDYEIKLDSVTEKIQNLQVVFRSTNSSDIVTNVELGTYHYLNADKQLTTSNGEAASFDVTDQAIELDILAKVNPMFYGTIAIPQEGYFEGASIEGIIEFKTNYSTYRTDFSILEGTRSAKYRIIVPAYSEEISYVRIYLYGKQEIEFTNFEFDTSFYMDLTDYEWYGSYTDIKEEKYYQITKADNEFNLEIPRKKIISGSIQVPETEVLADESSKLEVGLSVDGNWYEQDVEIEAGSSSANYQMEVSSVAQNLEYLSVRFLEIPQADTNLVVDRTLYYGDGQVSEYASEITPMPLTAADTSFDVKLACKRMLKGTVKLAEGTRISEGDVVVAHLRAKVGLQIKELNLQLKSGQTEYPYELELPAGTKEIEQLTLFVEENQYVDTNIAIGASYYNIEDGKWYTDAEKATSIIIDEDEELLDITVPKGVVFKAQLMKGDAAYFEGENLTGYAKVTVDGVDYISYYTFYEGTNSCEFKIYLPIETQIISAVRLMVYKNSVIESNILCGKEVYLTEDGWSAAEINAKSFDAGNGEINQILTLPLANTICGTVTVSQEEPVNGKVVAVVAGQEYKGTFSTENGSAEYKIELPPEDGGEYQLYYQLDLEDSENYVVGKVYVDGNGTYHLSDKFAEKTAVVKGTQYRNIKVAKWQDLQEDNLVESSHPYENGKNYEMVYTYPGTADSVTLTFSEYTYVEDTFDTIYIYDAGDNIVGTYSGGTLAGENVTIPGNTAKIVLSADPTQNAYGFGIEKITVQNGVQSQDVEISLLYENGNATKAMLHNRTGIEKKLYISSAIYDQLGKMLSVTSEKIKVQADIVAMDLNYEKDEETAAGKVMMYDDHLIPLQESNYKVYPTYSVTYNYNDAISSSRISYLSANAEIECPNIEPERSGYIFTGWYTTPECTEPYIFGDLLQENITIYAGWTKLYETVTDVIGLGEFSSNLTGGEYAQAGQEVVVEAVPEDGWMFAGWEVSGFDESEQYVINGASITYLMPQNTVYLTAKFVREIEVVWTSTGVYGYETVINEEGEEVEEPYEIFFNDDQIILPAETEKVTLKGYMDLLSQNITEVRWDYGYYLDEIEDKVNYKTLGETLLILDEDGNFTLSDLPVGVGSNTLTLTVVTESGERTLEYYLVGTRDDVVLQDGVSFMDLQKMTDAASVEDFASGIEAYWNYDNETPNDLSDDKTVIIISKQSEIGQRLMLPENDENKIGVGTVWVIPACDQFPAGFSFKIDDYGEGKYAPPAPEDDVYYGMTFSSEKYLYMLTIDPEMGEIFGDSFSITTEGVDGIAFSLLPQNTLVECTLEQEDGSQVMATMGSLNTMGGDDVKGKGFQYQNLLSNIIPKATVKSNKLTIGVEFGDTVLYDKDGSKNTKWDQLTLGGTIEMKNMAVTGAFEWHPHVNLNPLSDDFGVEVLPEQIGLILDYTEEKALKLAIGGTIGGDPSADEDTPGNLNLESIVKSFKKKFGQGENKKEIEVLGADIGIKGTDMDDTIVLAAIGFNLATQTPVNGGYSKIESTSTYLGFSPVMVFMIYLDVEGEVHAKICYQYTQTTYNAKGFNVLKDGEKGSNKKIKALTPKKTIDLVGYKGQIFNVSQASKTDKNEPTGVHTITATGKAEFHMGVGAGVGLMLCGLNVANLKAGLYADAEAELLGGVTLQKGKEPDFDMDGRLGIAMGILLGFYTQLIAETPIGDAGFEGEFEKKYELASWGLSSWSISGKVKQPASEVGAEDIPLANVKVTLRKKSSTQQDQVVYTSAEGKYSFKELDPGEYIITCEKDGYAKVETDEIELSSKSEEKDISMKLDKFVQLKGTVKDSTTREVIEGASIVLRSMSDSDWINYGLITDGDYFTIGTAKDSRDGVAPGVYKMSVKADGYKPAEVTVVVPGNVSQDVVQIDPVYLVEDIYGAATVGGVIRDLATGRSTGVALLLELRRGLNNQTGTVLEAIRLESDGNYRIELPAGTYTMTIKDDRRNISDNERYHTSYFNIEVVAGRDRYEIDGYVGQAASENQIRVVLTWGRNPSDLDSHMLGPAGNGYGRFHTYYSQKEYHYDNKRYVGLDLDDTTSYGPETTTIYFESGRGTYSYYVHDYSNRSSSSNTALANSEAVVKVYRGSRLVEEYRVPNGIGTVWHVFDYYPAIDEFIESGTMSNQSNPGSVGGDGYYLMSDSMGTQESRDIMTILGNLEEK